MGIPTIISFHDLDPSPALESLVRKEVAHLVKHCPQLKNCRVAIELPHQKHRKGNAFHVRVEMGVAGHDLVVSRDPGPDATHDDAYLTVRDAFRAAERELERWRDARRGT